MATNPPPYPTEKNYPPHEQPGIYPNPNPNDPAHQQQQQQYPAGYQPVPTAPPPGSVYYAQQQGPGQQQFVVAQAPTVIVARQQRQSFVGHIVLACFTAWCCGCVFGIAAFVLALVAQSSNDPKTGRMLGFWSLGISIAGIVIGTAILIYTIIKMFVLVGVVSDAVKEGCPFIVEGSCYGRRDTTSEFHCISGHWAGGFCYRNRLQ